MGYSRSSSGIEKDYAMAAAVTGISLLATAVTVGFLSHKGGYLRMMPLFEQFGGAQKSDESGMH